MDPLTHSLVGGLAAKTMNVPRRRFWIMLLLGMAPDLDVLANGLGGWAHLFHHRGFSHSMLGVVLQTGFYAWALRRLDPGPFRQRAFAYVLPIGLHVLCDALTGYGVPLFSPFGLEEFSVDLVVNLSVIPWVFMVPAFLLMARGRLQERTGVRWMLVAWAVYFGLSAAGKVTAGLMASAHATHYDTVPSVYNPFQWRVIASEPALHVYRDWEVNLLTGTVSLNREFPMPNGDFPVQASMMSADVKEFLDDTRWPVVRYRQSDDGWRVEWGSLLFSVRGAARGKLDVALTDAGDVISANRSIRFWDPL